MTTLANLTASERASKWNKENRERRLEIQQKWNRDNLWKRRIRQSARDLGFDPDWMVGYFQAHNGLCDVCGRPPTGNRLSIDHNHVTGELRGLLCINCNTGLGMFKDNPELLLLAVDYLDKEPVDTEMGYDYDA